MGDPGRRIDLAGPKNAGSSFARVHLEEEVVEDVHRRLVPVGIHAEERYPSSDLLAISSIGIIGAALTRALPSIDPFLKGSTQIRTAAYPADILEEPLLCIDAPSAPAIEAPEARSPRPVDDVVVNAVGLGYGYGQATPPVLLDVDLSISQGKFVAVVGPSGAGKTTLLDLLIGLRTPTAGTVIARVVPALAMSLRTSPSGTTRSSSTSASAATPCLTRASK